MIASTGARPPISRVRAFGYFVIAVIYFFFSQMVAHAVAQLLPGLWPDLIERILLVILLLIGYGFMGRAFEAQDHPLAAMGLGIRDTSREEFGRGAALGWSMLIASILPMLLTGGLLFSFYTSFHQYLVLVFDLLVLALASLAEEIAFRGYPFQRLIEAIGPFWATLLLSAVFGLAHMFNPSSTAISIVITMVCGWFLSIAYLRTRALWLPWGWHFAWNTSMALLFGLPISGLTRFSPVVQSDTIGPAWLTGGYYGPEAGIFTLVVMLIGIPVLLLVTRSYAAYSRQELSGTAPAVIHSAAADSGTQSVVLSVPAEPGPVAPGPVAPGPVAIDPRAIVIVPPPVASVHGDGVVTNEAPGGVPAPEPDSRQGDSESGQGPDRVGGQPIGQNLPRKPVPGDPRN